MRRALSAVLALGLLVATGAQAKSSTFRLHLFAEPVSFKPWEQKNSTGIFFLGQVFGTLLKYQDHELKNSLAEKCEFKTSTIAHCLISKTATFSDGSPITAKDFERSFQNFLKPENHAFRADLLFSVKNAEKFYLGKSSLKDLGIHAKSDRLLEFLLEKSDPEFLYNLTSPLLTALHSSELLEKKNASELISSGSFKMISWEPRKKILLVHRERPELQVEFIFVNEDSVALNLYEKGEIQFLRRLPTLFIPKYRNRPDYHEVDQIRFDYLGFGPELKNFPELREALSTSLQFSEINKLLFTRGSFGCPGLPDSSYDVTPCLKFDLLRAKEIISAQDFKKFPPINLVFSKLGGDDFKRTMEWLQNQWKTQLGIQISLEQLENKIFLQRLREKPPAIFRKSASPDRPTCLSALEIFTDSSNENYLQVKDPEFIRLFSELRGSITTPSKYKKSCRQVTQYLLDHFLLIPTGPIHFSFLASPLWTGWSLNELNQLDLSNLKPLP